MHTLISRTTLLFFRSRNGYEGVYNREHIQKISKGTSHLSLAIAGVAFVCLFIYLFTGEG